MLMVQNSCTEKFEEPLLGIALHSCHGKLERTLGAELGTKLGTTANPQKPLLGAELGTQLRSCDGKLERPLGAKLDKPNLVQQTQLDRWQTRRNTQC